MTNVTIVSFPRDPASQLSADIIDNGLAGYLVFFEGTRRREETGWA
jgi:hypothetical protein